MITRDKGKEEVCRILDGWFGETLEDSENEDQLRKYLYEPLYELVEKAYQAGGVDMMEYMKIND